MTQVLNYHDAVVYDTDVGLFGDGQWLNDNCINWFFRVLEHETYPGRADILFMDPAVVSCMMNQCDDLDEFVDLGRGLQLASRSTVFVPVNNATGPMSRGSHWSLLVFERERGGANDSGCRRFRHFDSSEGSNRRPAERTAAKFLQMLDGKILGKGYPLRVEHVRDAPQQRNAFDCGMYTILLAERLASKTAAVVQKSSPSPTPLEGTAPSMNPRQDKGALSAGEGRAGDCGDGGGGKVGHGGGVGCVGVCRDSGGVDRVGVKVSAEAGGLVEEGTADGVITMSPGFVCSARTLARERLSRCIRTQGWS